MILDDFCLKETPHTEFTFWLQVNIWNIICLNCGERYEDMIAHRSYTHNLSSCEMKAWKKSGLKGIRTHDLCDTGAVLYQLSCQADWELVALWVETWLFFRHFTTKLLYFTAKQSLFSFYSTWTERVSAMLLLWRNGETTPGDNSQMNYSNSMDHSLRSKSTRYYPSCVIFEK